jgi:hypothetical protein
LQAHKILKLPRYTLEDLESIPLKSLLSRAFVLDKVFEPEQLQHLQPEALAERFGSAIVDFYPQNMQEESVKPFFMNMSDAVSQFYYPSGIYRGVDASDRQTYIQWNINYPTWKALFEGVPLPAEFTSDEWWLSECFETDADRSEYMINVRVDKRFVARS